MSRLSLISAILLLTLFSTLTIAAKFDKTSQFDFDTTVRIQDNMPLRLQPYLIKFVEIGNWQIMSVFVMLTMILQPKRFLVIGLLYISIAGIEIIGKQELQHPPPPQFMTLRFQDLNLPKYYVRQAQSYPSGHAARAAFLTCLWLPVILPFTAKYISRMTNRNLQTLEINLPFGFKLHKEQSSQYSITNILLFLTGSIFAITSLIFAFMIGFIKVYLGEHWISDVIAGWLLGSGLALLAHSIPKIKLHNPITNT